MNKEDLIKKSYDFAADLSKQMITLSTAIITLCVAFTDKLFTSESALSHAWWLIASLILFILSILFGIFNLMGMTGQLGSPETASSQTQQQGKDGNATNSVDAGNQEIDISIYGSTNRVTSIIQVVFFMFGMVVALFYIILSTPSIPEKQDNQSKFIDSTRYIKIIRTSDYAIDKGVKIDTLLLDDCH